MADDSGFGSDFGSSDLGGTSGSLSSGGLGALAIGGAGALGLGAILARGESKLPWEYGAALGQVPALQQNAGTLFGESQQLYGQGSDLLAKAGRGELTPEQTAQLQQYRTGLSNEARQIYASMGRNPDQDTSFISTTANIDAQVNAMAQQQIQSTIQLGLGELGGAASFSGQALAESTAASNLLLQAGQAQLAQDKAYSDSLTSVFASIGKIAGAIIPAVI